MKLKINPINMVFYFMIIPFLFPRGFFDYIPIYKSVYTIWLFVSIIVIYVIAFLRLLKRERESNLQFLVSFIGYFLIMTFITILIRNTFADTLQKIFATPAICFLCLNCLQREPARFIKVSNNIVCIVFILNTVLFNPWLWPQYFKPISNHLFFLGHVQVGAQFGILGIVLAFVEYFYYSSNKRRFVFQISLALITMLMSFTSAAYIAIIFLIVFWLLNKTKLYRVFTLKSQYYIMFYLMINVIILYIIYTGTDTFTILGFSLNGRGFIWKKAIESFLNSPIYGYGVHGVFIKVFWSSWTDNGLGMNYMHNQILQVLNDGGIVLFIPFIFLLNSALKKINKISDSSMRFWFASLVLIILIIMTFESTMEYFYIFYVLCIYAYLPKHKLKNGDLKNE